MKFIAPEIEPGCEYAYPGGKCFFCPKKDAMYAKKDAHGVWHSSCWSCVKGKVPYEPPTRKR